MSVNPDMELHCVSHKAAVEFSLWVFDEFENNFSVQDTSITVFGVDFPTATELTNEGPTHGWVTSSEAHAALERYNEATGR